MMALVILRRTRVVHNYVRGFSSKMNRIECEEKHHLARALSRVEMDASKQNTWAKMTKKWKKKKWMMIQEPFEHYLHSSPRYEHEALEAIHKISYDSNVLLEIRDVRLPASSHHPSFTRLAKHRTHLVCYTHADMIDVPTRDRVERWTETSWPGSRSIFVDTRSERGDAESFDVVYDGLLHHMDASGGKTTALTVGVPNTGKSSVLLALLRNAKSRGFIPKKVIKQKANKKGRALRRSTSPEILDVPGKTRTLTEYLIRQKPRAFFLDVPGMTPPSFFFRERPEAWYGYGAINCLPLSKQMIADPDLQVAFCDYVLHCLNRDDLFHYVDKLQLEAPTDDIHTVLMKLSNKYAGRLDGHRLLLKRCATFLKLLNTGNLGPIILDDIRTPYKPFRFRDEHFKQRS